MKEGWERSRELNIPEEMVVKTMLKPFLKERKVAFIQVLSGGLNNSNIKITTDDSENYVLRIFHKSNKSIYIEEKIAALFRNRVPVLAVLYSDFSCSVFDSPFLVLSWAQGTQFSEIIYKKNDDEIAAAAGEAGEALARIHHIRFPDSGFFDMDLNIAEPMKLDGESFVAYIEESILKGYVDQYLEPEVSGRILSFCREHAGLLKDLGQQNSLVHGDFNPLNLLIRRESGKVRLEAVLDWEYALSGTPLLDIGNMLRYENLKEGTLLRPFIRGYQRQGGYLSAKWLRQAKLLDIIPLCQLLNKEGCGAARVKDIRSLLLKTMEDWACLEEIQAEFV